MAIRWRKSDIKELQNYVRKFNAKITRITKKNPSMSEFLPSRLNVQNLKETITERKDFNALKRSVNRFMKKGSEKLTQLGNGVTLTQWKKKELSIQRAIINRRKSKLRARVGDVPDGRMGTLEQWQAKELPKLADVKFGDWGNFVSVLERQAQEAYLTRRNETYLANWVTALFNEFGEKGANEVLAVTENIDRDKLLQLILERDDLSVSFIYSLVELEDRKERLIEELSRL